ncbi:hypothetical protein [Acinetobacter bereziniae]|uniref:hypothetical protein n=1 Tax=Acinetobacter bereziniae TaxID=106648 RepID=UPI001ABC84AB|nr:hypothetical protein [Acinetobacter bereziniae]MBO3655270.1 hypothetical protein [Acinetobacter bereziniae]
MRKGFVISIISLILISCGGSDNSSGYQPPSKIYAIDTFSGEYDLTSLLIFSAIYTNYKTYSFDSNRNFLVNYSDRPIFRTEVLQNIITQENISTIMPPQLENYQFLIGEQANFNEGNLQYTMINYLAPKSLILSWNYKKIDVSGKSIETDQNNPMHVIRKSPNAEIFAAIIGIGYSQSEVFPEGSVCWQKQTAQANQEYIEFYPEKVIRHVSEESQIQRSGQWNKASWIEFETDMNEPERANIKLDIDGKVYWGFYHRLNEKFIIDPNKLTCDYMNETAFKAAMFKLDVLTELRKLGIWDSWAIFYSDD